MVETYTHPNHLRAFALVVALMFGTFMVVPFISLYFVSNVGLREVDLFWIYVGGGVCSIVSSPLIGRWADLSGKLRVYRIIAPLSALVMLAITTLPRVGLIPAVAAVSMLMVCNSGRMIAAMSMINASVESRLRGGFMSAYSSVQHISAGVGSGLAGLIIIPGPDKTLLRYGWVGVIGMISTLFSVWLAGQLRPASKPPIPVAEPTEDLLEVVPAAEAF
jgi:MFS transporter, DHA1 family, inner membrane transport protein